MRINTKPLAATALAVAFFAMPAYAGEKDEVNADKFAAMCDTDKDGMVSKAEMMKMVEKMYDKHDTKKMGKLDKKQTEAF
jgi:hypothetical protein